MRNILKGDFSEKINGGLSYNFLFKTPFPSSYSPLKLGGLLIYSLWKNLEELNLADN